MTGGRAVCIDLDALRSVMAAYSREMMAFLLFNQAPARILLLGLGGGSLAKFRYRLPFVGLTAVDVNAYVIFTQTARIYLAALAPWQDVTAPTRASRST